MSSRGCENQSAKTASRFRRRPLSPSFTHFASPSITKPNSCPFLTAYRTGVQWVRPTREPPRGHVRPNQEREKSSTCHSYSWKTVARKHTSVKQKNQKWYGLWRPLAVLFVAAPPCWSESQEQLHERLSPGSIHRSLSQSVFHEEIGLPIGPFALPDWPFLWKYGYWLIFLRADTIFTSSISKFWKWCSRIDPDVLTSSTESTTSTSSVHN